MCRQLCLWLARNSRNNDRWTVPIPQVVLDDQHGAVSALLTPENRIQICMIDLYNVPITVDTRISVVPVLRTLTQDVPLFLNTVPM